jgi:hypothetical protein
MKQVRRGLTLSTLNVFIHHYFSLSWLREYIMNKKVYNTIKNGKRSPLRSKETPS